MMKTLCLSAAILAMAAVPSFAADECGPIPIAPAFPSVADLAAKPVEAARKDLLGSYHLVRTYQGSLKSFRECMLRLTKNDENTIKEAQAKPDEQGAQAKIDNAKRRIADRQQIYDKTLDSEQRMASEFNTLRVGHCQRDTDPKICPQKK